MLVFLLEKFLFYLSGKMLYLLEFALNPFFNSFDQRLLLPVFIKYQHISIFIMCLKTGIVPILNKMQTHILNNLALKSNPDVMPRQSWFVPLHPVNPKLSYLREIFDPDIIEIYPRVHCSIVLDYRVLVCVIPPKTKINTTHQH